MKASATTVSNHPTIKHVEQEGKTVTYFLSDGTQWVTTEDDLINYIEENGINQDEQFSHNTSPSGQDPRFDVMVPVYLDPQIILDQSWETLTEEYYKHIFRLK